jgi:hypothetical protein
MEAVITTIGHGLGVTPSMINNEKLNYGGNWWIAHKTMPTNYLLEFKLITSNILKSFATG